MSILNIDPTRTITLRRAFSRSLSSVFRLLMREVIALVMTEDAFGLRKDKIHVTSNQDRSGSTDGRGRDQRAEDVHNEHDVPRANGDGTKLLPTDASHQGDDQFTTNKRWRFKNQAEATEEFEKWLKDQVDRSILSPSEAERWKKYVGRGFEKGANRAFDDLQRVKGRGKRPLRFINEDRAQGFVEGRREQFLRQSLAKPSAIEKLKQIQSQALSEVRGLGADLVAKGRRVLSDGLIRSLSPREIAAKLSKVLKVSKGRAETIAFTELVRAHAEGQLEALDQMGVKEVGVAIEWSTASNPCKACEPMKGVVLKIGEARGMLPRHPRCRCAWVPANIGEDKEQKKGQKRSKTKIDRAIKQSRSEAGDDWEADTTISKKRPKSEVFTNAACTCTENELTFSGLLKQLGIL